MQYLSAVQTYLVLVQASSRYHEYNHCTHLAPRQTGQSPWQTILPPSAVGTMYCAIEITRLSTNKYIT